MNPLRISGDVFLNPYSLLFQNQLNKSVFPFNTHRVFYYYFGRTAIWQGLSVLNLKATDEIIAPIYNCGTEIDPLLKFGLKVRYYDQHDELNPDLGEIGKLITAKTKAIYITHFFGFPQPVQELRMLCDKHELFLIEDCAPAMYSNEDDIPLGSTGDISIFSFRKTLPLTDGSALVVNNQQLADPQPAQNAPLTWSARDVLYFIKGHYIYDHNASGPMVSGLQNLYNRISRNRDGSSKEYETGQVNGEMITMLSAGGHYHPGKDNTRPMSQIAMRIILGANPKQIIMQRRENFAYLQKALEDISDIQPIYKSLPLGVCPLNYPVIVEDRQALREFFAKQDIALGRWWRFFHEACPWENFLNAVRLKNHLVSIPIHQGMNQSVLSELAEKLKHFFAD